MSAAEIPSPLAAALAASTASFRREVALRASGDHAGARAEIAAWIDLVETVLEPADRPRPIRRPGRSPRRGVPIL